MNHPSKLTRLALLILALPACGTYAAADYSTKLNSTSTFSVTDVTPATLAASDVTKVGTASDLNENYIGWDGGPSAQVALYWTSSGVATTDSQTILTLGGAEASASKASSSYNALTLDSVVELSAEALKMGYGALIGGTGADAKLVDTSKLANGNVLNLSGAGYQTSAPYTVSTTLKLTSHSSSYVGGYGNNNAVNITGGAKLSTVYNFTIGSSDENNPTYGCNNSVSVSGSVRIDVIGSTNTISSTLALGQDLFVGMCGSGNTLTVADNAKLTGAGTANIGYFGDNNKLSVSSSDVSVGGGIVAGRYPGSDGNEITFDDVNLNVSTSASSISIGRYSVGNKLTVSDSTLHITDLHIGLGDDDADESSPNDGTKGYVATEGCTNTATITNSKLHTQNDVCSVLLGYFGSDNTLTIKDSSIYSAWTDAGSPVDGKVQFDEIGKIASIVVGNGYYSGITDDYASFGKNNMLTLDNVVVKTTDIMVGTYASNNTATLKNGTKVGVSDDLFVGNGDDHDAMQGSGNTILLSGSGTSLEVNGQTTLGNYGSNNVISVSEGAKLTLDSIDKFGYGIRSTATTDNTAYGSDNVIEVTGEGSSLAINDDLEIGYYGSNNELSLTKKATATIQGAVRLGVYAEELGNVLKSNKVYSTGNKITVASGASLTVDDEDGTLIGIDGNENSMLVTGEGTYFDSSMIVIGARDGSDMTFGSFNSMTVSDGAVAVSQSISIGGNPSYAPSSNNTLTVDNATVVATMGLLPLNYGGGENNVLRIKNGMIALKGENMKGIKWTEFYLDGYTMARTDPDPDYNPLDGISMVDKEAVEIWDASIGAYRKATKADLSMKYCATEAEAIALTGYAGLAGYTILTQANDLSRLEWAGDVYDGGNGYYCSSWYGWFYNNEAYGDYIMSCNNNAWQYVEPSSTPQSTYLYDYSLNSWLYTDETNFQDRGVYNYSTAAWMRLGK